jgi:hypothetical protein
MYALSWLPRELSRAQAHQASQLPADELVEIIEDVG